MRIRLAENKEEWNRIVEKSPYSVLHHRYEIYKIGIFRKNPLPLIAEEQDCYFLIPLRIAEIFRSFRMALTPIYDYASIIPDDADALDSMPIVLDHLANFLCKRGIAYLSMCAPTFYSKPYVNVLNSWFQKRKASTQVLYAHVIRTGNMTFEMIWKQLFDKHARYNVRRAEREGVNIVEIDTEGDLNKWIDDIIKCNLSALRRQGREGAYPDSYKDVYLSELIFTKSILGEYYKIYGAVYQEHLIAYMIVVAYNKFMQVGKAMSHTKYLGKRPNDALISHIVKRACERGFEVFEYGLRRTRRGGEIPGLHPDLDLFVSKFGFEERPLFIYRLGLNRTGRVLQYLFSLREFILTRYAYLPEPLRDFLLNLYAPRRRNVSDFVVT